MLNASGLVKVEELATHFGVSEMTVRRDLERLEKDGIATRCYGGAVKNAELMHDDTFEDRQVLHQEQKQKIAAYCQKMIRPGSIVFLEAGSTVLEIAKLIANTPDLTVITNDINIAAYLVNYDINLIMIGGIVQRHLGCVHGYVAEKALDEIRIDMAFVSGLSVDKDFDVFAATESKVYFRRKLIERSNKTYLVMDSSKFFKQSLYKINNLSNYTAIISDKVNNEFEKKIIQDKGINWITVE